jgi:hypothetical protein
MFERPIETVFFLSLGVNRPGREADRSTPFGEGAKIPLLTHILKARCLPF